MQVCRKHNEEDCSICFKQQKDRKIPKSLAKAQRRALEKALNVLYRRWTETGGENTPK